MKLNITIMNNYNDLEYTILSTIIAMIGDPILNLMTTCQLIHAKYAKLNTVNWDIK